jgi:SAM-dependent methyltransferase
MFFPRRATQAEYFDSPDRPRSEVIEGYASLASVNRLFVFAEPFQRLLPKFLGPDNCRCLSILDVGAGDGSLGQILSRWAQGRGWNWDFTNLDINPAALQMNPGGRNVTGSALELPFADNQFDLVIASQVTHHFSDDEVVKHLRECWRVARRAVYLTDLHRNPLLYGVIRLLFLVRRFPRHFQEDGLLSVKRGFQLREMKALVQQAGIPGAEVQLYYCSRLIIQARKH